MNQITAKLIGLLIGLSCIMLLAAGHAMAGDHNSCKIDKVGVYPGLADPAIQRSGYPVFLSCDDLGGNTIMFYMSDDMGDAGLATALTAMSLGKSVWARTTTDAPGGLVTVMYLAQ